MTSYGVYVGTYKKYSEGCLTGGWLYCEDYNTYQDFLEACAELHKDEEDPEFMYQDIDGFPRVYYSESGLDSDFWDVFLDVPEDERGAFLAYCSEYGQGADYRTFQDSFYGAYDSEVDFARQYVDDCGLLDSMPEDLKYYFDFESYANDLFINDFNFIDGYVFRR